MTRPMMAALMVALTGTAAVLAQSRYVASPPGESASEVLGRHDERQGYVGGKWLEIRYGRPIKRGRNLFGPDDFADALNDGAPVWRAGANATTRLKTAVSIEMAGKTIAPGEYSMFIDLQPKAWSLILSAWPAQTTYDENNKQALWGAYDYTPDKDLVRAPMTREKLARSFEQLSWQFVDMTDNGGRLALLWDRELASVAFKIVK
jgi:hypothetical protein